MESYSMSEVLINVWDIADMYIFLAYDHLGMNSSN